MVAKKQPQAVPPPFQPNQSVRFEGKVYQVVASTHTHTQLEGVRSAIANWKLEVVEIEEDEDEESLLFGD